MEYQTHRAVIIDLGLAKFSRNGLSSAVNLGNEAYSPPEVLQMGGDRDKRSDVWAMGKIIAELCARVRLPTQSVSAIKIRETLKDQPYCSAVSKMVEVNPANRTSMAGIITDIRRAGSVQQVDIRHRDIPRDIPREIPREIHRDIQKDIQRDIAVAHVNEMRPNQKWYPPAAPVPKMDERKSPVLYYRQDPLPQREMGKALVPVKGQALNHQLSLMSFPCPLPETGKVTQERYIEESGALEYKEIVTRGGKIIKYEKVQITKNS